MSNKNPVGGIPCAVAGVKELKFLVDHDDTSNLLQIFYKPVRTVPLCSWKPLKDINFLFIITLRRWGLQ